MDGLPLFRFVNNDHEETDDYYNCESVDMVIRNLPSVTPRINLALTSQDCISREEAINEADNLSLETSYDNEKVEQMLRDLPPVIPQRKKGRWINKFGKEQGYDIAGIKTWYIQIMCDKCGFIKTAIEGHTGQYKYCPNCGAEMSGGAE